MQSSSTVRNYARKLPPLKESAARLASKLPSGGSITSSPDIATLLERFDEPLREGAASTAAKPVIPASGQYVAQPRPEGNSEAQWPAPKPAIAPVTTKKSRFPIKGLISALLGLALVPTAVLVWQDRMRPSGGHEAAPTEELSVARAPAATNALEVALSSPDRIAADAGEEVQFPIAIDATGALPARSIVAITALPEGASFSQGRPYGVTGWSLRPDEIAGLRLRLPARSAASDMRLELIAGDGTVLSQSETRVSTAAAPPQVATVDDPLSAAAAPSQQTATAGAVESAPAAQIATAEESTEVTGAIADAPPAPLRRPASAAGEDSSPTVNTVKVVTIAPPHETKPHDGAYGLGPATEEAQTPGEWMETKTAVDMHAKAEQSSETVKVAEGGLKVRVTARDKRWVQVTDPATSTTGWIYDRFLTPADAPAD